jgi:hypothetical protein
MRHEMINNTAYADCKYGHNGFCESSIFYCECCDGLNKVNELLEKELNNQYRQLQKEASNYLWRKTNARN